MSNVIAITGASGFVGRHLVDALCSSGADLRLLIHRTVPKQSLGRPNVSIVRGDLRDASSLGNLFKKGATVVHLAYSSQSTATDNIRAMENLADACRERGVRRLVHVSTAVVVGKCRGDRVDETTRCQPVDEYEATKLAIERTVLARATEEFDVAILRPTAVFGPGGKNLLKLAHELTRGNSAKGWLKRSLYGNRRLNAVAVENVVSAIRFLVERPTRIGGEVYIVSDDECPENNYRDVEAFLRKRFGLPESIVPRAPLPGSILSALLRYRGRSSINPGRNYDCHKLLRAGWVKPASFEESLDAFADWYECEFLSTAARQEAIAA